MALAIDTIDGRGLSNKRIVSYFQEEHGNAVFAIDFTVEGV